MKKLVAVLVVLAVVLGAAWAGSSYWFGMKAEEQYRQILAKASSPPMLKFLVESYKRGIFASTAKVAIEFGDMGELARRDGKGLRFVAIQEICHGPFPMGNIGDFKPVVAVIRTTVQSFPEMNAEIKKFLDEFPELKSSENRTTVFFSGDTESVLTVPAFRRTLQKDKKTDIVWEGLSAHFLFSDGLRTTTGSVNAPGLQVTTPEGTFALKTAKWAVNLHRGASSLNLGNVSTEIASIDFKGSGDKAPESFRANGIKLKIDSKESANNCVDATLTMGVEQAKAADKSFDARLSFVFRKLDAESLRKFQDAMDALNMQPPASEEEMEKKMAANYLNLAAGLLKKSPEVELTEVKFTMPEGTFNGKAKVVFTDPKGSIAENPLLLLNAVTAEAECTAQESLVRYIAAHALKNLPGAGEMVPGTPDSEIAESDESPAEVPESEEEESEETEPGAAVPDKAPSRRAEPAQPGLEGTPPGKTLSVDEQVALTLDQLVKQDLIVKDGGNYKASASYRGGKVVLNGRTIPLENLFK